jgi:hypothetical protein
MAAHGYHPAGWVAKIRHREKRFYLGFFKKEYDAVQEYNRAAYKLYGQFAYLNYWDGPTKKEEELKIGSTPIKLVDLKLFNGLGP